MKSTPNREQVLVLLREYNKSERSIRHALAVEAAMIHFACLMGEANVEKWGNIGLIHDLDFEMHPENHCIRTRAILMDYQWPEEDIRAVMSHGYGFCTDIEPVALREKVLYAVDELTGFVLATALMRPGKCLHNLEVGSVMKKWKQKSFAAGVNRDTVEKGALMLGMDLEVLIRETIEGMKPIARDLGLEG